MTETKDGEASTSRISYYLLVHRQRMKGSLPNAQSQMSSAWT